MKVLTGLNSLCRLKGRIRCSFQLHGTLGFAWFPWFVATSLQSPVLSKARFFSVSVPSVSYTEVFRKHTESVSCGKKKICISIFFCSPISFFDSVFPWHPLWRTLWPLTSSPSHLPPALSRSWRKPLSTGGLQPARGREAAAVGFALSISELKVEMSRQSVPTRLLAGAAGTHSRCQKEA